MGDWPLNEYRVLRKEADKQDGLQGVRSGGVLARLKACCARMLYFQISVDESLAITPG